MQGEIDGVNYTGGMMPSIASNGDEYVANVLTYIRNEFGNEASLVTAKDVAAVKKLNQAPENMWDQKTLEHKFSKELTDKAQWKVSANFEVHPRMNITRLTDNIQERQLFSSKEKRAKGQAITIELPKTANISEVIVNSEGLTDDYSRHYIIEFSNDGKEWFTVINNPAAVEFNREQTLGYQTKFIRITNQVGGNRRQWRLNEISLFGSY